MSKLYLRQTTNYISGYARTEKSATMPLGTFNDMGVGPWDLYTSRGSSSVAIDGRAPDSLTEQSNFFGKWISDTLHVGTIPANTWTFAGNFSQSWSFTNAFVRITAYVLKADDTVLGYIYDSAADLGTEFSGSTGTDVVVTFTGSSVTGVTTGSDRLVVEVWAHYTASMSTGGANQGPTFRLDGSTDLVDGVAENDPACFISTPDLLFGETPTKLYFRDTTTNIGSHARTELSTTMPLGSGSDAGYAAHDLSTVKGSGFITDAAPTQAISTEQSVYHTKFISNPLKISLLEAGEWTIAGVWFESSTAANYFLRISVYVLKSDDTVRGYVYDAPADLGIELATATATVVTFTGSEVLSVVPTDVLAVEWWYHAIQSMSTAYNVTARWNGTVEPANGDPFSNDAAYILAPVDLFPPDAPALPSAKQIPQFAVMGGRF